MAMMENEHKTREQYNKPVRCMHACLSYHHNVHHHLGVHVRGRRQACVVSCRVKRDGSL